MKKSHKILFSLSLILLLTAITAYYQTTKEYTTDHLEVVEESYTSESFIKMITSTPESEKGALYNMFYTVSGEVTKIEGQTIFLNAGLVADVENLDPQVEPGQTISLKARLVGYDDLFEEARLDFAEVLSFN